MKEKIINLKDSEFNQHITTLKSKLSEKDKKLSDESNYFWNEIYTKELNWKRKEEIIENLNNLTKNDLNEFFYNYFSFHSNSFHRLIVQLFSNKFIHNFNDHYKKDFFDKFQKSDDSLFFNHNYSDDIYIDDIKNFKLNSEKFPI
jgi:secreted Zn-dependent insulinase-like peptidase